MAWLERAYYQRQGTGAAAAASRGSGAYAKADQTAESDGQRAATQAASAGSRLVRHPDAWA